MGTTTASREQVERFGANMCVAMVERNGYHDSYFSGIFAVPVGTACAEHRVPDSADVRPGCVNCDCDHYRFQTFETGATAYAGGFVPVEDADEIVLDAYRDKRDEVMARLTAEREAREARTPDVGKDVTFVEAVTRGKNKTAVGVTGQVNKREVNTFDSYSRQNSGYRTYRLRVVLNDEDRVVWVDEAKVRVTGHEDEDLPLADTQVDYMIAAAWPHR